MKTKEVYIGNGQTINAVVNEEYTNFLDMNKLREIVESNPDKEIKVGATEDWFFTARKINQETLKQLDNGFMVGLLMKSCWDSFSVEIDGDRQDCTVQVPKKYVEIVRFPSFIDGVNKIQFWLGDILPFLKTAKYEEIKLMTSEMQEVMKKYIK